MYDIPEEAVKAALDTWRDHEFDGTLDYPRMRNALTAAAPFQQGVKVEPWGWVIPRGGSKKPIILEASKFDQASAAAEADIHDLGYFPIYTQPASDPSPRAQALEEAARKAQKAIAAILMSGGLESDKWWDDLVSAQQSLATAIRALHPVADKPDEAGAQGEGWRPIESAPKDGEFLAYTRGGYFMTAWWLSDNWITETIGLRRIDATHWRPLPSAPSEGAE